MSQIITDLSVQKEWVARRGVNNQFTLNFTEDGEPFDISEYTFILNIRKIGANNLKLQLDEADGLINGTTSGVLSIQLSESNTDSLMAQSYFYSLEYDIEGVSYGLLHGTLKLVQQYNENQVNNEITVSVNLAGSEVNLNITLGGSNSISVSTQTSTATLTPDGSFDAYEITAQAAGLTISNPSTDYANFDGFVLRVTDNGTARALTFGNKYRAQGDALPTTTTLGKVMIIIAMRDSNTDKYDVRFTEEV